MIFGIVHVTPCKDAPCFILALQRSQSDSNDFYFMGARRGDGAVWLVLHCDAVLTQNDAVVTRINQTET